MFRSLFLVGGGGGMFGSGFLIGRRQSFCVGWGFLAVKVKAEIETFELVLGLQNFL